MHSSDLELMLLLLTPAVALTQVDQFISLSSSNGCCCVTFGFPPCTQLCCDVLRLQHNALEHHLNEEQYQGKQDVHFTVISLQCISPPPHPPSKHVRMHVYTHTHTHTHRQTLFVGKQSNFWVLLAVTQQKQNIHTFIDKFQVKGSLQQVCCPISIVYHVI